MMKQIPVSVVIPTRNRMHCAIECIAAALEATTTAQIIVADSSDGDALEIAIRRRGLDLPRLKYLKTPDKWNVVQNFEGALGHCEGRYVLYIGDDDLVGPHLEMVCDWARAADIDVVIPYAKRFGVAYYWPGVKSKYFGDAYQGKVFVWSHSSRVRPIDLAHEIAAAKRNIGRGLERLPRVYHGLVSNELLRRVRARHGHVFGGVSPDIYSAILIAAEARRAVHLDYPFCIPGASPVSEAGAGAAQTDRHSFEDSPYLRRFKNLKWDPAIPRFFSPYNGWGYSFNEALKQTHQRLEPRHLNLLYARNLVHCWPYRQQVWQCVRKQAQGDGWRVALGRLTLAMLTEGSLMIGRVLRKALAPRAGGWATRHAGFATSLSAYRFLAKHLPPPTLPKGG